MKHFDTHTGTNNYAAIARTDAREVVALATEFVKIVSRDPDVNNVIFALASALANMESRVRRLEAAAK